MKNLLEIFLDEIDVRHTHKFASQLYNEHPNKYNMLGLKQMLHRYGVESVGIKQDEKELEELVYPCILHVLGDFVIGRGVEDGVVEYLWNGKETKEPAEDFRKRWSGNALLPINSPVAQEPDYKANLMRELTERGKYLFIMLLPLVFVFYGFISNGLWRDIPAMSLSVLNLTGMAISLLLIQKQLFKENKFADRICSMFHQKDCNNVLFSEKAKLLDTFSWSEIGTAYFLVQSLSLVLYPACFPAAAIISWLAMPYGIWSVWYQWRVVKQWCMLCLIVQMLVWTSGILAIWWFFVGETVLTFDAILLKDIVLISLLMALAVILLHFVTSSMHYREELATTKQKYNAIKADEAVFNAKLQEQEEFVTTKEDSAIIMGAEDAKYKVTVLSNPHCEPCAKMHERISKVLEACKETVSVQYILSAFNDDLLRSNRFLIAAFLQTDYQAAMQIYELWYKEGKNDADAFISRWDFDLNTPEVDSEMERHKQWREKTKLTATPTIIVNNRMLPTDTYQIEDLINL